VTLSEKLYSLLKNWYLTRRARRVRSRFDRITLSSTFRSHLKFVALEPGGKICLYSTHDNDSVIDDYVVTALKYWNEKGFQVVVISTSPNLPESEMEKIAPFVASIIHRVNLGLDFASWSMAIQIEPAILRCSELLLTNDSVFGPFWDFYPVMTPLADCVQSVTDSYAITYHLQSYFLLLGKNVVSSPDFKTFIEGIRLKNDKAEVVREYEMGLSQVLGKTFALRPMFPYKDLLRRALSYYPEARMHYFHRLRDAPIALWDLLLDAGCPFLKRSLLQRNPGNDFKLNFWQQKINDELLGRQISAYLARTGSAVVY